MINHFSTWGVHFKNRYVIWWIFGSFLKILYKIDENEDLGGAQPLVTFKRIRKILFFRLSFKTWNQCIYV